jgi:hypothetical protein
MRQQVVDAAVEVGGQPFKDLAQVGPGFEPVE